MNILITGHRGFIGSALYHRLEQSGHTVFGVDKVDKQNLLTCELPSRLDLVIHLAGASGVRDSVDNPGMYWTNNVEASKRLFSYYYNTRVLYASSSAAYEPELNPYAASKLMLEHIAAKHSNALGLRLHTVYSNNPRKGMFFDKLLSHTLEYTTGHYRDFIHLYDVLDAFEILINNPHITGVIDVGTGDSVKIHDLAPDLPIHLNTPYERTRTCANTEHLLSLGFKPKYSVKDFLTSVNKGSTINIHNGENT